MSKNIKKTKVGVCFRDLFSCLKNHRTLRKRGVERFGCVLNAGIDPDISKPSCLEIWGFSGWWFFFFFTDTMSGMRFITIKLTTIWETRRCFEIFLIFTPTNLGKMIQFDLRIFFKLGWFNHHLGPRRLFLDPLFLSIRIEQSPRRFFLIESWGFLDNPFGWHVSW